MNDLSQKLAKILEDPESIKMITEIAGNLIGESSETEVPDKSSDISQVELPEENQSAESVYPVNIPASFGKLLEGSDIENTVKLINALKPYMTRKRRENAENVLKILGVMKVVGNNNFAEVLNHIGK